MVNKRGRRFLTAEERVKVLKRLSQPIRPNQVLEFDTVSDIYTFFRDDLYNYFCATQMARATKARDISSDVAEKNLFKYRVKIESAIINALQFKALRDTKSFLKVAVKSPFSYSKKQGVSFRLPLKSCVPTKDCGNRCYAHDGMDAAAPAVVKGALNYVVSQLWDMPAHKMEVSACLEKPIIKAINFARSDATRATFSRRPRIRFAHVGELPATPAFSNYLAKRVSEISGGSVDCVVYTRHPDAKHLDSDYFVINFTIDRNSRNRIAWAPEGARIVASSFNGEVLHDATVNFLEHHRDFHFAPHDHSVEKICPATAPNSISRTCDGNECATCFSKPVI